MPVAVSYPGVYIEELSSGVRTITGVATSITAFIGRALKGPADQATTINSFADFERLFGGLWTDSKLGYALRDFYLNGGSRALIVRLYAPDDTAAQSQPIINAKRPFVAVNQGTWGRNLRITIDADIPPGLPDATSLFNLIVAELRPDGAILRSEQFRNLSLGAVRPVDKVINAESQLLRWKDNFALAGAFDLANIHAGRTKLLAARKTLADALAADPQVEAAIKLAQEALDKAQGELDKLSLDDIQLAEKEVAAKLAAWTALRYAKVPLPADADAAKKALADAKKELDDAKKKVEEAKLAALGSDGKPLALDDFMPPLAESEKKGLFALDDAELFNLLCIPPYRDAGVEDTLLATAAQYCERRRAMLLVDPLPAWNSAAAAIEGAAALGTNSRNAALFFPMLRQPDPLRDNQLGDFAPCGALAGVFARTDTQRGVWKAPAGLDATLVGVPALSVPLTDAENGQLNPLGINCLRAMPAAGRVVWGARTLQGADRLPSEWKYIPVRRTALFIEESLYRGTQWVVFEPNDEPLWAQIRLNVGAFMQNLFRQGAFQGKAPQQAYFVKCDKETTTQNDINLGIVNVAVGFAPLKPAEFVVIKLQQIAGQVQA
jgi:phage tail sheath protein FI